jgi:protein ImuB
MLACVLLPRDDRALAQRLFAVSPGMACDGACVFLDLRGLQRLHRHPAGVFAAIRAALAPEAPLGMALADNRFTAEVAARHGRGPVTVRAGEEAAFLSHLPLDVLALGRPLAQRLLPLGLRTLGDFASLPRASVERRYGAEGLALHRLACGEDRRALLPQRETRVLSVLAALENPADRLALLLPALESALAQLCAWVAEEGCGIVQLALQLVLDPGLAELAGSDGAPPASRLAAWTLVLPEPETRQELLLDLLRGKLEAAPPGAPVTALTLQALRTEPRTGHQNSLFGEIARDAARRTEALARLAALFGRQAVTPPQVQPAHRLEQRWQVPADPASPSTATATSPPAAGRPARSTVSRNSPAPSATDAGVPLSCALRWLPEPEELVPVLASGALASFRRGRHELRVARLAGPRRLSGGWWQQPWERDEYELLTDEGALYRVCRDGVRQRWLLLAELD